MKKKYLVYLLVIFGVSLAKAQSIDNKDLLNKSYEALKNIKTLIYKVDYSTKYLASRDTVHRTAICSLYVAPKNKMKTYNIVDLEHTDAELHFYGHRKYDGKKTLWANYDIDSLNSDSEVYIDTKRRDVHSIVINYSDLLLKEYFMMEKPFKKYEKVSDRILVTEELHKDLEVYVITVAFRDQEDVKDNVEKHYIRKSDFLPVAFQSFLRWENMEQYNYYEIEYLEINPDLPLEKFKVSKNEIINAEERYKEFKQKTNL